MKLSTKCRYGARALVEIAKRYGQGPIKRKEIVEIQDIADSYLENILVALRNAGLIRTIRGAKGGYSLSKAPEEISFLDIVEAIQGSISPIDCLDDESLCQNNNSKNCVTRPVWMDLYRAEKEVLSKHNLQTVIDNEDDNSTLNYVI